MIVAIAAVVLVMMCAVAFTIATQPGPQSTGTTLTPQDVGLIEAILAHYDDLAQQNLVQPINPQEREALDKLDQLIRECRG